MSDVIVKINSVDKTNLIDWPTFQFDQALTQQIDTVKFSIKRTPTKTFKPELNDDIEVLEDAVLVFGGKVVKSEEIIEAGLQTIQVTCKDHSHEMDGRLVVDIFENNDPETQPNYAAALNNFALLLQATNRLAEAEPLMRRALAIDEQAYGDDHPEVARHLNNLAQLLPATNS